MKVRYAFRLCAVVKVQKTHHYLTSRIAENSGLYIIPFSKKRVYSVLFPQLGEYLILLGDERVKIYKEGRDARFPYVPITGVDGIAIFSVEVGTPFRKERGRFFPSIGALRKVRPYAKVSGPSLLLKKRRFACEHGMDTSHFMGYLPANLKEKVRLSSARRRDLHGAKVGEAPSPKHR
jgi:hypothetical protein